MEESRDAKQSQGHSPRDEVGWELGTCTGRTLGRDRAEDAIPEQVVYRRRRREAGLGRRGWGGVADWRQDARR